MKEIVCVVLVILFGCLFMTFAPDEQKLWKEYDAKQKELMKELFKSSGFPEVEFKTRNLIDRNTGLTESEEK